MKKTVLSLTLLAIGVCKGAAGPEQSFYDALPDNWQQEMILSLNKKGIIAIPENFHSLQLRHLYLSDNEITIIPGNFAPPLLQSLDLDGNKITAIPYVLQLNNLKDLDLSNNDIQKINPQRLLEQFPKLLRINLSGNTNLDKRLIDELRERADKAGRDTLEIIAEDIRVGMNIKG